MKLFFLFSLLTISLLNANQCEINKYFLKKELSLLKNSNKDFCNIYTSLKLKKISTRVNNILNNCELSHSKEIKYEDFFREVNLYIDIFEEKCKKGTETVPGF